MAAAVQIKNLSGLRRALRQVGGKELADEVKKANLAAAQLVARIAEPNVPVRTGNLRATVRGLASQASGRAVAGGARAPYARAVHWGRRKGNVGSPPGNHQGANEMKGKPFMWDAAEIAKPLVIAEYERAVESAISKLR